MRHRLGPGRTGFARRGLRGARGRGSQPRTREAPAKPSAGITTGCPKGLDAAATKGGGSCPDRGPTRAPLPPGSTAPGTKIAAWSAAGRAPFAKGRPRRQART
jgi:hypothetical protein